MGQTNYQSGHDAEQVVVEYLKRNKFKIKDINWKTRICEIDIVAEKKKVIYFIEVKYRKTLHQGSGLEYITDSKLSQMRFAAENWVQETKWKGEYQLAAAEVSGEGFTVTNFLTEIF